MNIYERFIHYDEKTDTQIKLIINEFNGIEYLQLRKYYRDFDGEWQPSSEGVSMELQFDNIKELFTGIVEILSIAEAKDILEAQFKEQLDKIYL